MQYHDGNRLRGFPALLVLPWSLPRTTGTSTPSSSSARPSFFVLDLWSAAGLFEFMTSMNFRRRDSSSCFFSRNRAKCWWATASGPTGVCSSTEDQSPAENTWDPGNDGDDSYGAQLACCQHCVRRLQQHPSAVPEWFGALLL